MTPRRDVALMWLLAGGATLGSLAALVLSRKRGAALGEPFVNDEDVDSRVSKEIPDIVRRARKAGARGDLRYIGAGMTAVVVCDARNRGFKVGRHTKLQSMLAEEADWLETAGRVRAVHPHVARFYRWHPGPAVIERECVEGRPGRWADEGRLFTLHQKINDEMLKAGWTAPEFKGDSYIIDDKGHPKLVDASMPSRVGQRLVEYTEQRLRGRLTAREREDMAFALRMERGRTIPANVVNALLPKLGAEP